MTEAFAQRVHAIDREQIRRYLQRQQTPCYESQLFQIAFPGIEIATSSPLALYQHHFLLFHVLYQLQEEFYQEGAYLFIHFMRTVLRPYPSDGLCRFFHERLTTFCQAACLPGQQYCSYHQQQIGEASLEELSLKYFYADARNFYKVDEDTVEAFMNGAWEILTHYDAYRQSFAALRLPETADLSRIRKQFKRLARQYHPDLGTASHEKFIEINTAYRFLLRVIPGRTF